MTGEFPALNPIPLSREEDAIVAELMDLVQRSFPEAQFEVRVAADRRIYLTVYSDSADDFAIQDRVAERTVDVMIRGQAKIHVMPRHTSDLRPQSAG